MMAGQIQRKEVIRKLIDKGVFFSLSFINKISDDDLYKICDQLLKNESDDVVVLNEDVLKMILEEKNTNLNWIEFDKSRVFFEKTKNKKQYDKFISYSNEKVVEDTEQKNDEYPVKILFNHEPNSKKREVQDFVEYFNSRFNQLKNTLKNRPEMENLTSINRILNKKDKENISFIGIVVDKSFTKNDNLILTLEDETGMINVLVNKNKPDLFEEASSIVYDEVIGVNGVCGQNIVFANNILWPEIPLNKELKKSKDEVYAIFLSDLHIGSKYFLPKDFERFLKWIRGEAGNQEQIAVAKKVKYIFLVGDLVDGGGIYPGQEDELILKDIYDQYAECAKYLQKIPKDKKIIICAGNHDAMRISEPQPMLYKDFAKPIWEIENTIILSNPSLVNIHSKDGFSGFDVLLYHGYSFDYYAANVEQIRMRGGYDRADIIMKFLLKRRHLAPTHGSTLHMPTKDKDYLVIEKIPDIFATGHIHKTSVSSFKNITLVCGSCWQSTTPFQEKVGHHPEPSRIPIINLQTRDVKVLKF